MKWTAIAAASTLAAAGVGFGWYLWPDAADDRPVAIVNADKGRSGKQLADALAKSPDFRWAITTEGDARSDTYSAIVTVPTDFTAAHDSAQTEHPERATVTLSGNNTVVERLSEVVAQHVDTREIDSALGAVAHARSSLSQLSLGTQFLSSGIGTAKVGADRFASGVTELNGYLAAARDGSGQLAGAVGQLNDVVAGATAQADSLAADLSSTGLTVGQARDNADLLSSGLAEALGLLRATPIPLTPDQNAAAARLDSLRELANRTGNQLDGLDALLGAPVDPATDLGKLLKSAVGQLNSASSQLSKGADELSNGLARLSDEGGAQLDDASAELTVGIEQLDGVSTALSDQVARALATTPQRGSAQQSAVAETLGKTITVERISEPRR